MLSANLPGCDEKGQRITRMSATGFIGKKNFTDYTAEVCMNINTSTDPHLIVYQNIFTSLDII